MSFDLFHLDGERGLRGGERQLLYLASALRARGHRNAVVCRAAEALAGEARRQGFEVIELRLMEEWNVVAALKIRSLAKSRAQPVLHSHTSHAVALGAMAGLLKDLPHVAHRRVDFPLRSGLSAHFKYGAADAVVGVSRAIGDILKNDGLAPSRIEVVSDGIPVTSEECRWSGVPDGRFSPPTAAEKKSARESLAEELEIDEKAPWVGNLAALVPHKDHDNLLAAAVLVQQRRPNVIFLIAGEGPEEVRLRAQICRMGLENHVHLIGQRAPEDLLKAIDLFTLSSWGEGMGSVLLEAMASGVPIAATSAGGIPETVVDQETGLLCPPRDPESLSINILKLLSDKPLALKLAEEARERLPRFGLARMAEQMERIYEKVSAGRHE